MESHGNSMTGRTSIDRRGTARRYDALLPEYFPVRLVDDFIRVDFAAAAPGGGPALDARISPRRMLAWLRSMPSYRAGVPVRIGQETGAGVAAEKGAELAELLDPGRPAVWVARQPLTPAERALLSRPRGNLLLEAHLQPGAAGDALALVRSAEGLDPRAVHWQVGPLAAGDEAEAGRLLEALPPGSRLTLRGAAPGGDGARAPLQHQALARLEALAHALGHAVTDWTCRGVQARVGLGFFDVDRITGQADLARRAHDLITCAGCPSRTQCHGPLDEAALRARLDRELGVLGLAASAPPRRVGPRAIAVEVAAPTTRGDEAYLSHALGQPVAVTLSRPGGSADEGLPAVLRRWYATGFLPVTELNAAAEKVLEDLARRAAC